MISLLSGKVKGELPDGGWCKYWGQTSKDPQRGVDSGQPPFHQVLWSGEKPQTNNSFKNLWEVIKDEGLFFFVCFVLSFFFCYCFEVNLQVLYHLCFNPLFRGVTYANTACHIIYCWIFFFQYVSNKYITFVQMI